MFLQNVLCNVYVAARPERDVFDDDSDTEAGTQWSFGRRAAGHSRHTPRTYGSAAAAASQSEASEGPGEAVRPSVEAGESSLDVHVGARRHRGRRVLTSQTQPDVEDV